MRSYELLTAQGGGTQEEGEETEDLTPGSVPEELPDTMPPNRGRFPKSRTLLRLSRSPLTIQRGSKYQSETAASSG
jgi:hypothetical protein